ncbi:MAG: dihydroorotate dehydrogenase electron transfer subunit [Candidatus Omnitrophica bacterium]|nr:dihydroorotate dehydrogenase electron transfer subunit [Candidatus Omnitrophota bacterium]
MEILSLKILRMQSLGPDHYWMELENRFKKAFSPGQFLTLRPSPHIFLRRPFSVASASKTSLGILFRKVGAATTILTEKNPGQEISALGPLGRGFPIDPEIKQSWLVAGGTGVAPLLFLLERLMKIQKVSFFYGAGCQPLLFRDLFPQGKYRLFLATDDGSCGIAGPVTALVEKQLQSGEKPEVIYSSGPLPMLQAMNTLGLKYKIPVYVSLEIRMACGLGLCLGCVIPLHQGSSIILKRVCHDGPIFLAREVLWKEITTFTRISNGL